MDNKAKAKKGGLTPAEIVISFLVIGIVGLIIIPLPTSLLDIFIVTNLTIAINILLITLFTKSVLEFSTFPTVLLITTMFKLGLNMSSTRSILTTGNGGHVIEAFADVVAGENYIVGIILFVIIMIVQLVVVTNGSGRVSEVSARFTLDAMPGKQMAIDSDLNSGAITEEQARQRRKDLQREADFYGSMDGASKFVKGDAIAGIIIVLVNLIGGTIIFTAKGDLSITDALSQFGKLAIGDGLVSSVPSLLISLATGVIVTRSEDNSTFGTDQSRRGHPAGFGARPWISKDSFHRAVTGNVCRQRFGQAKRGTKNQGKNQRRTDACIAAQKRRAGRRRRRGIVSGRAVVD